MDSEDNDLSSQYLWNSRLLTIPKLEMFQSTTAIHAVVQKTLLDEYRVSKHRNLLFLETITLSKFMDERRNKYRSDKGFKLIGKIEKSANRVFELDFNAAIKLLHLNCSSTFVPSRQLCHWLLVKYQSYGQLLHRILECSKNSFSLLHHRLRTGHNWIEITTAMAMVSRIWCLSNFLIRVCCKSYSKLYSILGKLRSNANEDDWLPSGYILPRSLRNWISNKTTSTLKVDSTSKSSLPTNVTKRTLRTIKEIDSYQTLKKFFFKEEKLRCNNFKKCITNQLDSTQWLSLKRHISKLAKKLRNNPKNADVICRRIQTKLLFHFVKNIENKHVRS